MEPGEIFQLIVKADEKLKYATADKSGVRRRQAGELLKQALSEAEAIANVPLAEQARTRLADIGESA